jgi:hypothetical protein
MLDKFSNGERISEVRFKPKGLVTTYLSTAQDDFHSQYQFDHTYRSVRAWIANDNQVSESEAALWLSSLLAHWGMYRASSRLKDKNTLFFRALIQFAAKGPKAALGPIIGLPFERMRTVSPDSLDDCFGRLSEWLEKRDVAPTDTLITKIALGLTCNVPAYDRYFRQGLKVLAQTGQFVGVQAFGGRGLHDLVEWSAEYDWPKVRSHADRRRYLPIARIIDMAVFQFGLKNSGSG